MSVPDASYNRASEGRGELRTGLSCVWDYQKGVGGNRNRNRFQRAAVQELYQGGIRYPLGTVWQKTEQKAEKMDKTEH